MGYEDIRKDFFKMLEEHEKKKQLKATTMVFRAYSEVIAIMRGQLGIPLSFRDEAIAQGYESEALRAQLRGRPYGERGIAAVPPEHPLFTVLSKRAEARKTEKTEAAKAAAPPVAPVPRGPAAYLAAVPIIPEEADIQEITEAGF
jgi:hypothetical protein